MQQGPQVFHNHGNNRPAIYGGAVGLLLLGFLTHYGWAWFAPEHQRLAFNALGAVSRLILLAAVLWHVRSQLALLVGLWWVSEEIMVAGCSIGRIIKPWAVAPGESQCSALIGFDIGRISLLIIIALVWIAVRSNRSQERL
jgi:hypothetical protein